MNEVNSVEYNKELLNLYRKLYIAVTKCTEHCIDLKREEAVGVVLEETFGNEYTEEFSHFRKLLKSNILLFFAKKMTVNQVENLLFGK